MLHTLHQGWLEVRSSFWFLPTVMVVVAVGSALLLIQASTRVDKEALESWEWLFGADPGASRSLLTTLAGSMITVAGVVFSITLVALSQTSSQYSSRVLWTFMRNRANQFVLGAFVGIFAYCVVVLRTIRNAGQETAFVPSLAVLFALVLGFVGIGVLIFFIHHIARSIQATHILAQIEEETSAAVEQWFSQHAQDEEPDDCPPEAQPPELRWYPVPAAKSGYLQQVDVKGLLGFAQSRDLVVRMEESIGGFLIRDQPVASILSREPLDRDGQRRFRLQYSVGRQRTLDQDVAFGIRQMVDVAMKALSPSMNDTTTAVMSVDRLTAVLTRLADRYIPTRHLSEDGQCRLWLGGPGYADLVAEAFDQIRRNAADNATMVAHLLQALERLASVTTIPQRRQVLMVQAQAVAEVGQRSLASPSDCQDVAVIAARVVGILQR